MTQPMNDARVTPFFFFVSLFLQSLCEQMHYFVSSWDGAIQCYDARSDSAKVILADVHPQIFRGLGSSLVFFHQTLLFWQIQPDPLWTPDHSHKGDILTMDFCPEALLATGSIDGEVIIWNTK